MSEDWCGMESIRGVYLFCGNGRIIYKSAVKMDNTRLRNI